MSTKRNTKPPMPNNDDRRELAATRPHAFHQRQSAGAKALKAAYRAKHGAKPDTLAEARAWYAGLQEPKYRAGESKKRIAALEAAEHSK